MERAQSDRSAERLQGDRSVRMGVDVTAYFLDDFRIRVGLDLLLRLAALAGTKTRPLRSCASVEEGDVLRPGTPGRTGRPAVHAGGTNGIEKYTVHGAVAPRHRVPVARSPELLIVVCHFFLRIHHCKRR